MGKYHTERVGIVFSILLAIAMLVPVMAVPSTGYSDRTSDMAREMVFLSSDVADYKNIAKDQGADIFREGEFGSYAWVTASQKGKLTNIMQVDPVPENHQIMLMEQGISFNIKEGYDARPEWKNPVSNAYMIKFIIPFSDDWLGEIESISGRILRQIGNDMVVARLTPEQQSMVQKLDHVQWIGPYESEFKVRDILKDMTGLVKIEAYAFPDSEISEIEYRLKGLGASEIEDSGYGSVICRIDSDKLVNVAKLDSISSIDHVPEMKPMGNVGGRISNAWDLWDQDVSNLPQDIMGQGQIIHVQDTGIDATHKDFTQGPWGNRLVNPDSTSDPGFHGTFMTGVAAGNGGSMEDYLGLSSSDRVYNELASSNPRGRPDRAGFAGRAPEATIYFRAGLVSTEWSAGYTYGARIFSNSWGSGPFVGYDSTGDTFMAANPGALMIFPAGSEGPKASSIGGMATGKLVLGIGASENLRPTQFDNSDDPNQVWEDSSRGPVSGTDLRVKPDIVETGSGVYSVRSDDVSEWELPGLYDDLGLIDEDGDGLGDYTTMEGTSVAVAATAGDAALIRDYLEDVQGFASPHANVIKNLLIHGAVDIGYGYPSYAQGWGRVNVRNSICPPAPNTLQWYHHDGISSGNWDASTQMDLTVIDESIPLKITMSHWDSVGTGVLSTNYNLVAIAPDGTRYEGNAFSEAWSTPISVPADWANASFPSWIDEDDYDFDTNNNGGDDINNVEVIRIERPMAGTWDIRVYWESGSAYPFDIAVTGGMDPASDVNAPDNTYKVSMTLDTPRIIQERDDFGEGIFKAAPGGSVIVPYWINNGGATDDQYTMSTPTIPPFFVVSFIPSSPVSVNAGERVRGYAIIDVGGIVTEGTYTIEIQAISDNDVSAPIAQSSIKFQVDVVTAETPNTWKIADSPMHEEAPSFVSWESGGNDYVACAYIQDGQFGDKVYFTISDDAGVTWSNPIPISEDSWGPGFVGITRATTGVYEGRLAIAYTAWNPDGYGGSLADTRSGYVKVHYADAPYTTWTLSNAFIEGEGVVSAGRDTYRTTNIVWYPNGDQFYLIVEDFGYSSTDIGTASLVSISAIGKSSSDGGATWSALTRIDPGVVGMYYFFPHAYTDHLGNIALWYYERDSGEAAQDRDATFQYYTGSWSSMKTALNSPDNLMFPQGVSANQGVNGNRNYGAYLKGANTDGDRSVIVMWTDDGGDSFDNNANLGYGPYGPVASDHDYGSRFLLDMDYTVDDYMYVFMHRNARYDPYGQTNLLMFYDDDYTGGVATKVQYLTLDSYTKGKQRSASWENSNTVLIAQNQFVKEGGQDIVAMHVYNGWDTEPDILGPITEQAFTDKVFCSPGEIVMVMANVQDWQTGGNNIAAVQYKTDVNPIPVSMTPADGLFSSPAEAAVSGAHIDTTGWVGGWHKIWVQGQDDQGNWGDWTETEILIDAPRRPDEPTNPDPYDGELDVPVSKAFSVDVSDYESDPMNIVFYWSPSDTPFASVVGVASGATATTSAIALLSETTYNWYAIATDATGSTQSDTWTFTTIDTTPPVPVTGLTVEYDGPAGSSTVEQRYLTTTAVNVNGLAADSLDLTQSITATNTGNMGNRVPVYAGIRVWQRSSAGVETEITSGTAVGIASRLVQSEGINTATWTPPVTPLDAGDSIVVRLYVSTSSPPTTLRETFTTNVLGATQLDASAWTCSYYLKVAGLAQVGSMAEWGSAARNTNIAGFSWTVDGDPTDHNTVSWTESVSPDVEQYNIYRSDTAIGPWTLMDTVPSGTTSWVDMGAGMADATLWWYIVRAEDFSSNEDTNTNSVPEFSPQPPYYDIDTSAASPGDWIFVSFPITASGDVLTVFDDANWGNGDTEWEVIVWYDPTDADHWKTYDKAQATAGIAQDLPDVNNTMGMWVKLSLAGTELTVGEGFIPISTTNFDLQTGWNLIGYPAQDDSIYDVLDLKTATGATKVEGYGPGPYNIITLDDNYVLQRGEAYWVYVSSDITWTVDW